MIDLLQERGFSRDQAYVIWQRGGGPEGEQRGGSANLYGVGVFAGGFVCGVGSGRDDGLVLRLVFHRAEIWREFATEINQKTVAQRGIEIHLGYICLDVRYFPSVILVKPVHQVAG